VDFVVGDEVWRVGSWEFMGVESLLVLPYGSESLFSRNLWEFYPLLMVSREYIDMSKFLDSCLFDVLSYLNI